jgi:HSP20 family protein
MPLVCYTPKNGFAAWTPMNILADEAKCALGWMPAVDVRESDDAYAFEVDVPGLTKEDIQVEVEADTLTIRGERKQEQTTARGACKRTERRFGRFERAFQIGDGLDAEKIAARLDNGVLTVTLPKRDEAKPKHIRVTVN